MTIDPSKSSELKPSETELRGTWRRQSCRIVGDETCQRIEWLRINRLRQLASDASGWDRLYVDSGDGRLWELIYEQSEMHGGGPPTLRFIERDAARVKYPRALPLL